MSIRLVLVTTLAHGMNVQSVICAKYHQYLLNKVFISKIQITDEEFTRYIRDYHVELGLPLLFLWLKSTEPHIIADSPYIYDGTM